MRALALVAVLLLAGCGAAEERRAGDDGTRIAGHGLEITLPEGWHGDVTKLGAHHAATLRAATFPLGPPTDIGRAAQETMGADDLLLVVADYGAVPGDDDAVPTVLPMRVGREDVVDFEGFHEPVATTSAVVAGTTLQVWLVAAAAPTSAQLEQANAVLATLTVESEMSFSDAEVGVSGRHPRGWHRETALTGFVEPREVLALASYPLRKGADAGECAPDTAREDMRDGGAFVWLLEYRAALPPDRFPDRPASFRIPRERLAGDVSCFPGPGWSTTFGDAGRKFQLLVAFGGKPSDERVAEVEAILDSLEFKRFPPPPPDPYSGWPWLSADAGDSIRTPPGWAAASAKPGPVRGPYGAALFYAANRKLRGLPAEDAREGVELPSPLPERTLANGFPADGVLVWVLLESGRATLAQRFVEIDRDWPEPEDFEPIEIFTKPAPELRWRFTAGEFRGHRFSVWIGQGPNASEADAELALKSASSLVVSADR